MIDDRGRTIAAANLTPLDGVPADVGVLTRSGSRSRGAGTAVAAAATGFAIAEFGIARWRALVGNAASRRVAVRLGFVTDCLQLALRPE